MDDMGSVIEERKTLMDAVKGATQRIEMIDDMLLSQLEEEGATQTKFYSGDQLVTVKIVKKGYIGGQAFDVSKIHRIKELITKAAWDAVYKEAYQEMRTVPAKFDGTKAKKLEARGKAVMEALDFARNEQRRIIEVTEEPYDN